MNVRERAAGGSGRERPPPRTVRLPGFTAGTEIGLGDLVKRATTAVGVRPCGSCSQRAAALNALVRITGRR